MLTLSTEFVSDAPTQWLEKEAAMCAGLCTGVIPQAEQGVLTVMEVKAMTVAQVLGTLKRP